MTLDIGATVERARGLLYGRRALLGITGPPGAGESTLAAAVAGTLGSQAVVVPMDGFHLADRSPAVLGQHRLARRPEPRTLLGEATVRADRPGGGSSSSHGNGSGSEVGEGMAASSAVVSRRRPAPDHAGHSAGPDWRVGLGRLAALLAVDPLDQTPRVLPGGSLGWIAGRWAERPVGLDDPVAVAVVGDRRGGLASSPPAPGGVRHRAELGRARRGGS